ncbi:dual specificity protein phosphatase Mpk3 [Drosophila persimilis]|uniref:Dual specificity protein phosphatase n=1 Tax=Drosophila pseudoobscura pseudoobscura TaxID=46245 RepID=A0A6I8UBN9_DROPS|nr:dual specificity protein phosphatase Mpk3 [Drosophila pseudoobscura]XP_026848014.1 dual specificity protein phosphatase Mpk3 [Drosophila persimilis]
MPETEHESCSKEWLQVQLRSLDAKELILLDCRGSHEYSESHIRGAVNLCIPSIVLRRLATGKIDLASTIKSPDLKDRIQTGYKLCLFILYNGEGVAGQQDVAGAGMGANDSIINILHRRLKQDGCRVVALQDGFSSFRLAFPEWCEDDSQAQNKEMESSRNVQTDQLMGLRSLRISTPHSDSACSSSAESSDCESTTHHHHHHHHHHHSYNEAPVEIIPGLLFLGNVTHSGDSKALQKYNIKYVLNVTPDLPNEFEKSGIIKYLQIPITDHYSQDLAMHFPDAIQFIEEARSANSAVLVHCLAGVSRSVTVTLAYLMHTRGLSLNDAFMMVRDRKPDVSPNFHFMQQLQSFESQLRLSPGDGQPMDEGNCGGMMGGMGGPPVGLGLAPVGSSVSNSVLMANPSVVASRCGGRGSKFSCNCIAADCKCMQTGGFMAAHLAKATGVSPDSGIEFDRWTPSSDTGLK